MTTQSNPYRTVIGNISLSLDGRTNGPAGEYDMGWIVPHAVTDGARDHMIRVTGPETTGVIETPEAVHLRFRVLRGAER